MRRFISSLQKKIGSVDENKPFKVFSDMLSIFIYCHNPTTLESRGFKVDQKIASKYLSLKSMYSPKSFQSIIEAIVIVKACSITHPYNDLLGNVFMELSGRTSNGQFFTPADVVALISSIAYHHDAESKNTVYDPTCGSGSMLLGAGKQNPDGLFFGQDNDIDCVKMAAINLFNNGLRGQIIYGNTLLNQEMGSLTVNHNGLGIQPFGDCFF